LQDVADVLLDGTLGHHELIGDGAVGGQQHGRADRDEQERAGEVDSGRSA
jgi:hypothetical protein